MAPPQPLNDYKSHQISKDVYMINLFVTISYTLRKESNIRKKRYPIYGVRKKGYPIYDHGNEQKRKRAAKGENAYSEQI